MGAILGQAIRSVKLPVPSVHVAYKGIRTPGGAATESGEAWAEGTPLLYDSCGGTDILYLL